MGLLDQEKDFTCKYVCVWGELYEIDLLQSPLFKNRLSLPFKVLKVAAKVKPLERICEISLEGVILEKGIHVKRVSTMGSFATEDVPAHWRVYVLRLLRAAEGITMPVLGSEEAAFGWNG
jgi:hypothetical protein